MAAVIGKLYVGSGAGGVGLISIVFVCAPTLLTDTRCFLNGAIGTNFLYGDTGDDTSLCKGLGFTILATGRASPLSCSDGIVAVVTFRSLFVADLLVVAEVLAEFLIVINTSSASDAGEGRLSDFIAIFC